MPLSFDQDALNADLLTDEGERLFPYTDTVGKLTIGIGHNLTDNGIPAQISRQLLTLDVGIAAQGVCQVFPWAQALPEKPTRGLIELAFNMGLRTLQTFHTLLGLLQQGKYAEAADDLLQTKWARDVGPRRAARVSTLLRNV